MTDTTGETFLVRLEGGPGAGDFQVPDRILTWPLPNEMPADGGKYVKVSESQLPPQAPDSHVMRGAHYTWQADVEVTP